MITPGPGAGLHPLAENATETLARSTRVTVTGRLEQRSWETPEGQKRSKVEINASDIATSLRRATAKVTKTEGRSRPDAGRYRRGCLLGLTLPGRTRRPPPAVALWRSDGPAVRH